MFGDDLRNFANLSISPNSLQPGEISSYREAFEWERWIEVDKADNADNADNAEETRIRRLSSSL